MTANPNFLAEGFDNPNTSWAGSVDTANCVLNTTSTNLHVDGTGLLTGGGCMLLGYNGDYFQESRNSIPWLEVIGEVNIKWLQFTPYVYFRSSGGTALCGIQVTSDAITTRIGGSTVTTVSGLGMNRNQGRYVSLHAKLDATVGFQHVYVDAQLTISDTGVNTLQGTAGATQFRLDAGVGNGRLFADDYVFRPRTMVIDGVTGGSDPSGLDLTGGTGGETATIYGWQSATSDSSGGSGDPRLGANQYRLFLMDVSFGPSEYGATGFVNGESITIDTNPLTGTLTVYAPATHYQLGLEPGGMLYYQSFFCIGQVADATGTENTDGTLIGTPPADRLEALDTVGDSEQVRHTATGESVTVGMPALTADQISAIESVVGVLVTTVGKTDGASPNALIPRLLDNGATAMNGYAGTVGATNTVVQDAFLLTGAGAQWTTGTGAGGLASREAGYETA